MNDVEVSGDIKLGQFLKVAGAVDSGAMARELIQAGEVRVDGEVETRRGRTLHPGAVVELGEARFRVIARPN